MSERVDLERLDSMYKATDGTGSVYGTQAILNAYPVLAAELRMRRHAMTDSAYMQVCGDLEIAEAENARLRAECDARQGQLSKIQQKYRQYWNEQARAAYEKAKDDD